MKSSRLEGDTIIEFDSTFNFFLSTVEPLLCPGSHAEYHMW